MKKNIFIMFCKKYRSALFYNFANTTTFVLLYLVFLRAKIKSLKYDICELYPNLAWEEQMVLIENAKSGLIVKGVVVCLLITILLYFPLLLVYFKINIKESFFDCVKRIKEENRDEEKNS